MNPTDIKIFYQPEARLRLTVKDDRSYLTVKPAWAAPLSRPDTYLTLLDSKGEEITMLPDPNVLAPESLAAVRQELHHRYLTAIVYKILSAKQEFGATYWHVATSRGDREFITQNLQENALWLSDDHLLLLDVDGNRFEIPVVSELDPRSRNIIHDIL
ncbi:MAG: DUF1854 domain-containing protein [Abitibacteriaceae bacterium]|nr:DUF1854 domain-containing protein [Abditibacteriaceae bacterium]